MKTTPIQWKTEPRELPGNAMLGGPRRELKQQSSVIRIYIQATIDYPQQLRLLLQTMTLLYKHKNAKRGRVEQTVRFVAQRRGTETQKAFYFSRKRLQAYDREDKANRNTEFKCLILIRRGRIVERTMCCVINACIIVDIVVEL